MTQAAWQRFAAAIVLALLTVVPAASLCCLLTCAEAAHDVSSATSHCDTASREADPAMRFTAGPSCFSDTVVVPAELTRPYSIAPATINTIAFAGPPADSRPDARGSVAPSRIPPRASPLHAVLRI